MEITAHAYLFHGPDTEKLREKVMGVVKRLENNTPHLFDALIIEPHSGAIGIDRVRELKNFLWQKPVRSTRRTAVIIGADALTLEAQHALLKITEEPPAHGLIILTINDPRVLLETVISRFQKIYIHDARKVISDQWSVVSANDMSTTAYVSDFVKGNARKRSEVIKAVLEQDEDSRTVLDGFIKQLMAELHHDPIKNVGALKELLKRWTAINQYNVNKRLQLEAFAKILNSKF